ncbi:hypothetical protein AAW14_12415 [Streptomyces hygroscopicus]|nr:hypothetical protein [Streptomyces hygroscopicus]
MLRSLLGGWPSFEVGERLAYGVALEPLVNADDLIVGYLFFRIRQDRPEARRIRWQRGRHGQLAELRLRGIRLAR